MTLRAAKLLAMRNTPPRDGVTDAVTPVPPFRMHDHVKPPERKKVKSRQQNEGAWRQRSPLSDRTKR